ncbi:RsfA family transcriptional regulator [Terrilactibacillus sp. S3-3]|nr:RsfA family transcriptional regulator [Terrilactibacillus sp. S3-3]
MPSIRQDAWSHEEDLLLAETVLRHIREGSTQLVAFEEVGRRLSRTAAACGFRWNSLVRKNYEEAIKLAKEQRKVIKQRKKSLPQPKEPANIQPDEEIDTQQDALAPLTSLTLDEVIDFLNELKQRDEQEHADKRETENLQLKVEHLQIKYRALEHSYHALKKEYGEMKQNYASIVQIVQIVDKARHLVQSQSDGHLENEVKNSGTFEKAGK